MNMFGRDYEELGSLDKGLILKSSGKVKIQWGKKLIDLLDDNGNLNVNLEFIRKVSSQSKIKENGFYLYNGNLIAKVGEDIIELTSESGNTYVSFLQEQNTTGEQKYIALKNIGFIYSEQNKSNIYPKNGIIYIEDSQSLFIVKDGTLTKYVAQIPNPFTEQFVIQKNDNKDGALVIRGEGVENGILFDNLEIYHTEEASVYNTKNRHLFSINNKNILNITDNFIETRDLQSFDATDKVGYRIYKNSNGEYILDIDKINERLKEEKEEKVGYFDNKIYTERYNVDNVSIVTSEYYRTNYNDQFLYNPYWSNDAQLLGMDGIPERTDIKSLDEIKISTIEDSNIISSVQDNKVIKQLISIPLKLVECNAILLNNFISLGYDNQGNEKKIYCYLQPINYTSYNNGISRPKSIVKNFIFESTQYYNGRIIYKNSDDNSDILMYDELPFESPKGEKRKFFRTINFRPDGQVLSFSYYVLEDSLENILKTIYICSDDTDISKTRILYDFNDSEISLSQNNNYYRIGFPNSEIIHFKLGNIDEYKTESQNQKDPNNFGIFSDLSCFIGAEFRHPLSHKKQIIEEVNGQPVTTVIDEKTIPKFYNFPRYSQSLCDDTKDFINKDEIILPRKYIPKVVLEDFTNITSTIESGDNIYLLSNIEDEIKLYDGKLILLKLQGTSGNSKIRIKKMVESQIEGDPPISTNFNYYIKFNGSNIIEGTNFDQNTVLLLKFVENIQNNQDNSYFEYLCGNIKQNSNNRVIDLTNIVPENYTVQEGGTTTYYIKYITTQQFQDKDIVFIKYENPTNGTVNIYSKIAIEDNNGLIIYPSGSPEIRNIDLLSNIMILFTSSSTAKILYYVDVSVRNYYYSLEGRVDVIEQRLGIT